MCYLWHWVDFVSVGLARRGMGLDGDFLGGGMYLYCGMELGYGKMDRDILDSIFGYYHGIFEVVSRYQIQFFRQGNPRFARLLGL